MNNIARGRWISIGWCIITLGFLYEASIALGEEKLEEAVGLSSDASDASESGSPESSPAAASRLDAKTKCKQRGNFTMAYSQTKLVGSKGSVYSFPDLALSFTGDCTPSPQTNFFAALRAGYVDVSETKAALVDQLGFRYRPTESTVVVVGKERNRRAPGLLVSPSDFIHTNENLPGVEQERSGVWLFRASAQSQQQTADLMLLPVSDLADNGMPANNNEPRGAAVRYFRQFANFDFNLAAGRVDEVLKAGVSTQGFIIGTWRIYGEAGYERERTIFIRKREHIGNYLLGSGYDGDKYSARLEFFHNGFGLHSSEWRKVRQLSQLAPSQAVEKVEIPEAVRSPFLRQDYLIASLTLIEIGDVVNANQAVVASVEDSSWFTLSRIEWLANQRNVLGVIYKAFDRSKSGQYFLRPADWEAGVDWKWSF